MLKLFCLGLTMVLWTGCAHQPASTMDSDGKNVSCYLGESRMVLPNGRRVAKYQTLLRRVLMPEKGLIGEAVAAMIPGRPQGVHLVGWVVQEDGSFRFKEKQSGSEGRGQLEGKPWSWHAWTSTSRLGPDTIKTQVSLKSGSLVAKKSIHAADGTLKFRLYDRLSKISIESCNRRFERLKKDAHPQAKTRCRMACGKLKRCEANLGREKKELNHTYCEDTCLRRTQFRAFRCVEQTEDLDCSKLATCVDGRDID
jgi:hypothetical protein